MVWPGLPVILCIWHVLRNWLTQLRSKVKSGDCVGLFAALRGVMFLPKNPSESKAAFLARAALELEAVYTKFAAQTGYIDYHRKQYSSEERRGDFVWLAIGLVL